MVRFVVSYFARGLNFNFLAGRSVFLHASLGIAHHLCCSHLVLRTLREQTWHQTGCSRSVRIVMVLGLRSIPMG